MKKISSLQLALSFAGCFLGAGYVSGQELWQFFGQFGALGVLGLILSMLLILLTGLVMLRLSEKTGITEADKLIVRSDIPALRLAVAALELLFLFGVVCIMTAGVGSLFETVFGLPSVAASVVFIVLLVIISFSGFRGMVSAFSLTVPILCVFVLYFGGSAIFEKPLSLPSGGSGSGLLGSWFFAALSFFFYNIFGSIAMIAPLSQKLQGRSPFPGIALGTLVLLLIALSVLAAVLSAPELAAEDLPMLSYCLGKSRISGCIYAFLLLLAMAGTALSCFVGFMNMLKLKFSVIDRHSRAFAVLFALIAFLGSLFGFGGLIGTIYPLFGYCSSVFIIMMFIHYLKTVDNSKSMS